MDIPRFVVIGSGFSGSVFAERVSDILNEKVLIIEKRGHPGGNSFDYVDKSGIFIHKYGPHIFHTDSEKVWEYINKFGSFNNYKHKVLAYIDGEYTELPFDFRGIEQFFKKDSGKIKARFLKYYKKGDKVPIYELLKSEDTLLKEIGEFVYEKIFSKWK